MREGVRRRFMPQHQSALKADIDPPPTPWPFVPALAVLAVLFLVALQIILPATHFRHPADPLRTWIPIQRPHPPAYNETSLIASMAETDKGSLVIVMTKEADLRPVFVTLNSTISNTKEPEKLHFCVILPASVSESDCLKLKAVFVNLKVEILRDGYIIERMKSFMPAESTSETNFKLLDVVPFYSPKMFPSFERFVYLESDVVLQGDVEELIQLEMNGNPVAGVEDCSQRLETFFAMNLLEAAHLLSRNENPLLPAQPYEPKACLFDKSTMVIDNQAWSKENITEAVHWWIAMYHKTGESLYSNGHMELPFQLALYKQNIGLDALWSVRGPLTYAKANSAKLVHFDQQHKPWHQTKPTNFEKDVTGLWWKYISPATNMVFIEH